MASPSLLGELGMTERGDSAWPRSIPDTRPRAPPRASTRSCCPTRCTSPSTTPSRRPVSATRSASRELFDELPVDGALPRATTRSATTAPSTTCSPRCSRAMATGAAAPHPPTIAIVDWREVPTWTEFEILQDAFSRAGVPTDHQRSARSGVRRPDPDAGRAADRPGLPPRADQRHPGAGRRVPRAGRRLRGQGGLRRQHVPLQAGAQEGVFRGAHRLAARRSLFARRERGHPRPRPLDPRWSRTSTRSTTAIAPACWRSPAPRRDRLVLKPNDEYGGTGVAARVGSLARRSGTTRCSGRSRIRRARGWCRSGSRSAARSCRSSMARAGSRCATCWSTWRPYLFRGRMGGYLTRLSATGLANVTSGGGQVPAFVVSHPSA